VRRETDVRDDAVPQIFRLFNKRDEEGKLVTHTLTYTNTDQIQKQKQSEDDLKK
jgi:hypothetical protein